MDKKRLFSIGKLSKLTGVHIQSLRYYEELQILKPAYIDPQSQYRYYTFSHMRIVEAIQYCAELGIPLKNFKIFLLEHDGQIDYARLINYGIELTNQKMQRIQKRLEFLKSIRQELIHAESCCLAPSVEADFEARLCWAMPYSGTQDAADFHAAVCRLIEDIESNGFKAGYNNGQLLFINGNTIKSYIFIDLREVTLPPEGFTQIITIPPGKYLCKVSPTGNIFNAPQIFAKQFALPYDKVIVETELFTKKFNYSQPVYEIRCLLP